MDPLVNALAAELCSGVELGVVVMDVVATRVGRSGLTLETAPRSRRDSRGTLQSLGAAPQQAKPPVSEADATASTICRCENDGTENRMQLERMVLELELTRTMSR